MSRFTRLCSAHQWCSAARLRQGRFSYISQLREAGQLQGVHAPSVQRAIRRGNASSGPAPGRAAAGDRAQHAERGRSPYPLEDDGSMQFYATCHPGLEEVVAAEVSAPQVGAYDVQPGKAGVSFRGPSLDTGYRANLWLRAAIRVLVRLAAQPLDTRRRGGDALYDFIRAAADWPHLLRPGQTFSVEARVRDCADIPSSLLVQMRARDAICDAIRDSGRPRPAPPAQGASPDLPLFAALWRDHITLYRDMSGDSLHRRGYRTAMHKASLNESAAAGALLLAGWPEAAAQGAVLADPMCGSGTFLIEAALMASGTAPGLFRQHWPFEGWPDFEPQRWRACLADARESRQRWEGRLLGNDIHPGALSLAARDADAAGVAGALQLSHSPCSQWEPAQRPAMVITNPPWGHRLAGPAAHLPELESAWTDLGLFLKMRCPEARAFVLSGNKDVTRHLCMRAARRIPLTVGGTDCRLIEYRVLPPKRQPGMVQPVAEDMLEGHIS